MKLNNSKNETKNFCDNCAESGKCMLQEEMNLSKAMKNRIIINGSNKKNFLISQSDRANEPINDLENWQPHNLPKLKHETCPFHQSRSVGYVFNFVIFLLIVNFIILLCN